MDRTIASQWFAACPKGLESLLLAELETLGATATRETVAGVYFDGPQAMGYRACLWSRLANRILRPLAVLEASDSDTLYNDLLALEWGKLFSSEQTFTIDFSGQNDNIRNTQFGAQRTKDAIVDWFVNNGEARPSVARQSPDIRLNIRLVKSRAVLSVDYSGGSLHMRGYRLQGGAAPLKENLAAAVLLRADWPGMAARGGALIDPMCGSATLLIEGAMMAAEIAPGLARPRFGFEQLPDHNEAQWQAIVADARGRAERGRNRELPEIRGYDADPRVIRNAQENIARLQLDKVVRVSCRPLTELQKPTHKPLPHGLLISNPPYGERLGEKRALMPLYAELGETMLREFPNWNAAILTSDLDLGRATGLRSHKRYRLFNGPLESHLLLFDLAGNEFRGVSRAKAQTNKAEANKEPESTIWPASASAEQALSSGATMFANRVRKNRKRLSSWVKREQINSYRLYDADMPEYAVAIDIYGDAVHVAEYQAPKDVDPDAAAKRLGEVHAALPGALGVAPDAIVYKQRRRQRGTSQYEKQASQGEFLSVAEGQAKLLVNLRDYLDTGLFLDHRPLRKRIGQEAKNADFLNLFCYTGAVTVHAAHGGARSTTSVDLSNTYLGWLRKNLVHNGLSENSNHVVKSDCSKWLAQTQERYDLILLDPPSFSNSKSVEDSFDVQRDHADLVRATMKVLRESGRLYFSNNLRGFKLDSTLSDEFDCEDITAKTLDPDFQRNRKIHCCWQIRHRSSAN